MRTTKVQIILHIRAVKSFKILASVWADWFDLTWSKIPEDTFSRDVAQL